MSDKEIKPTPRQKFVNLANKRFNNAVKYIKLIGNLSDRSNYNYSEEDVKKIFTALRKEIKGAEIRFNTSPNKGKDNEFLLSA